MADIVIGAVAALIHVSSDLLRRAEREGAIPKAHRSPRGHRRWDVSQLEAIRSGLARRRPDPQAVERSR
jgi:DNA-binding transcriptional MerR regulator